MRVQLVSDIHLERRPLDYTHVIDVRTNADVLVLAGDIGSPLSQAYKDFLQFCHQHFKTVVVICGNHEYRLCMPRTFADVDKEVAAICASYTQVPGHRVVYLNNGAHLEIDGVNFIGATLWSQIPATVTPDHVALIDKTLHGMLIDEKRPFTTATMNVLCQQHLNGIAAAINSGAARGCKNVVVTHHAPLLKTMFKYEDYPKNYMYGTDLTAHLTGTYIHTWMYGHTHWNTLHNINGTMCVTNQYGNNATPCRGWSDSFFVVI